MDKYLIITPKGLVGALTKLIAQKKAKKFNVEIKYMEDFLGQGQPAYVLMRNYVLSAKAAYLLLVGDYDQTPGYELGTPPDNYRSDAYLCMKDSDLVPGLPIGRLSSNQPREIEKICDLLLSYPQNQDPFWKRKVILAGWMPRGPDCSDMSYEKDAGKACLNALGTYLEPIFRFENNLAFANNDPNPEGNGNNRRKLWGVENTSKVDLIKSIDEGCLIVRYLGHGSISAWENIGLHDKVTDECLNIGDVRNLKITQKLPLVLSVACYTGSISGSPSLAEAWQTNGKAIGVFAADVVSATHYNDRICQLILNELIVHRDETIGIALINSQKSLCEQLKKENRLGDFEKKTIKMYRYFGDPDTRLALPNESLFFIEGLEKYGSWRFESQHYIHTRTADNQELYTLTGIVRVDLKGNSKDAARIETIKLGIKVPEIPKRKALQLKHWAPFFTINAIADKENAFNAEWAAENFWLDTPHYPISSSVFVTLRTLVRDVESWLYRISYQITLSGTFVDYQPEN